MTHDDVARWLDAYVEAWKTYDPAAIGALFADDVAYRYHPYDAEPVRGRDAVVADWIDNRDAAGTYEATYVPWAVDGRRAVATGTSTYSGDSPRTYHNVFLIEFDDAGRATSFTETYIVQP